MLIKTYNNLPRRVRHRGKLYEMEEKLVGPVLIISSENQDKKIIVQVSNNGFSNNDFYLFKECTMNMKEQDELKREIQHIFESGANEMRVFEMVQDFINRRYKPK